MAITPPDSRVRMYSPAELLAYLDRDEDQGSGFGLGSLLQLADLAGMFEGGKSTLDLDPNIVARLQKPN